MRKGLCSVTVRAILYLLLQHIVVAYAFVALPLCCRSTLTGVPVDRQKLLCKGKTIKGDADLRAVAASGCPKIMLMGTAEEAIKAMPPPEKTVFVEDLTPAQQAALLREKKVEPLPNVRIEGFTI